MSEVQKVDKKPLPTKVKPRSTLIINELLGNAGMSMFVENIKNNTNLWTTTDPLTFVQQLAYEGQRFAKIIKPQISFTEFLHKLSRLQSKAIITNEIYSACSKHFNCKLIQIQQKRGRKSEVADSFVDQLMSSSDSDMQLLTVKDGDNGTRKQQKEVISAQNEQEDKIIDEENQNQQNNQSDDDISF